MKLIAGLGNPGEKYRFTRHNTGFIAVDKLTEKLNLNWTISKKFESLLAKFGSALLFVKPQTFMNSSGESIKKLKKLYKLDISDIWVIHDDLDIKLGQYKIQKGIGPKVHYGINSMEKELGDKDFWRVRVGVDNRDENNRAGGEDYVLQNFQDEELAAIQNITDEIFNELRKDFFK